MNGNFQQLRADYKAAFGDEPPIYSLTQAAALEGMARAIKTGRPMDDTPKVPGAKDGEVTT